MIFAGLLMDFIVISLFIIFARHGGNKDVFPQQWRLPIELVLFYGLRFICQALFAMQLPAGFYWDYPGFPSVTVPYGATNDFFYSGHVGACILCFVEYNSMLENGWRPVYSRFMKWISIFSLFVQAFTMLATRGHYTIDLISGIIFAHYIHINVRAYLSKYDQIGKKQSIGSDFQRVS